MKREKMQPAIIKKEMGLTHSEFYDRLPDLLQGAPYQRTQDTIRFQVQQKDIEISLGPEHSRELGQSLRLPVTVVTLRFDDFSEEEISAFVKNFNLKFMKGGG